MMMMAAPSNCEPKPFFPCIDFVRDLITTTKKLATALLPITQFHSPGSWILLIPASQVEKMPSQGDWVTDLKLGGKQSVEMRFESRSERFLGGWFPAQ